jgi:MFS family permease
VPDPPTNPQSEPGRLPAGVWALGFTALLMDVSSELVHSLLPVFLSTTIGASMTAIGILEGTAEATASITKLFSGTLSDYLGRRKRLVAVGYGLAAATKLVFPLATSIHAVFGARFVDRIGKGIREAPRDALIADLTPQNLRGAAYGLRQALDTVGAVLGPSLAVVLMVLFGGNIRKVFWAASVPAALAVLLLLVGVRDPARPDRGAAHVPISREHLRRLPTRYWLVVLLGGVLALGRFSEAFLVLRAPTLGIGVAAVPFVMTAMNLVYSLVAYPAGAAADRADPRTLLAGGLVALVAADLVLAWAGGAVALFVGVGLWGLHMGLTQALLPTLVASVAPPDLRGTAFGVFNLTVGLMTLVASTIAGLLWTRFGPPATFLASAVFTTVAMTGLVLARPAPPSGATPRSPTP